MVCVRRVLEHWRRRVDGQGCVLHVVAWCAGDEHPTCKRIPVRACAAARAHATSREFPGSTTVCPLLPTGRQLGARPVLGNLPVTIQTNTCTADCRANARWHLHHEKNADAAVCRHAFAHLLSGLLALKENLNPYDAQGPHTQRWGMAACAQHSTKGTTAVPG